MQIFHYLKHVMQATITIDVMTRYVNGNQTVLDLQ